MRCNCENSACSHIAGGCRMPAEDDKRLVYVGAVCLPCWSRCDSKYRITNPVETYDLRPPYQRESCTLPIMLRLALLAAKESPCAGCNEDRAKCKGEPKAAER